ncbi:YolD-like family protein [Planococcus lenghuensis]|uniref:YolD-like family protein n=1 Tax=Planococcus lenghuensis TaxID=2213202 RepID=A0A1Q2L2S5_9BACL|nr:YolD-like family protein [Planococcus lenghuensis]AQQ54729.1 hypothetical protein B0X71_17550 [Planococcus lenghuensis]
MKQNRHMKLQGDIKDRGMVKWQGMMLPEHNQLLRDWYAEDGQDTKPELTADDLELIQEEIETALTRRCEVKLKTWRDHKFQFHRGVIKEVNSAQKLLVFEDPFNEYRIAAREIVGIQTME